MKKILQKIMGGSILILTATQPASSESAATWKEDVGGWKIMVDSSQENSCFMITSYESGVTLRVGFNVKRNDLEFIVGSPDWRSIEQGKFYEMTVQFGNREPWTADGEGVWRGESSPSLFMRVEFDDSRAYDASEFIDEFMKMTFARVNYGGSEIAHLRLTGTNVAMNEVMACQAALLEGKPQASADPFQRTPTDDLKDPFQ